MSSQVQVLNLQPLHAGGHGDLFIGQLSSNGVRVVVKYLRECHMPHERNAFVREVGILSRGIDGIVRLFGSNTQTERPYYVMEYLPGGPLSQYAGRLGAKQLLAVATELAHRLANFHATVGSHGDFKPDNILLSQNGQLKIADPLGNGCGFTVLFSQNHGGTPGYWAPEVKAGGSISRPGDVYSYGATLYHLQTGLRPQDGRPLDPNGQGHLCDPRIQETIMACCQSHPKARPTMQEVLHMLGGTKWAEIHAQRKQVENTLILVGAVGGLFLLFSSMKS